MPTVMRNIGREFALTTARERVGSARALCVAAFLAGVVPSVAEAQTPVSSRTRAPVKRVAVMPLHAVNVCTELE